MTDDYKLTAKAVHDCIDPFIDLCDLIDLEYPSRSSNVDELTQLAEGLFRRNLVRFKAVHSLNTTADSYGSPALEITRNMLEDVINIEYIICHGEGELEELVERFFDFQWIQLKVDLEFYKKVGIPLQEGDFPEKVQKIEDNSSKVIAKYSKSNGKSFEMKPGVLAHSWLRIPIERLIEKVKTAQGGDDEEKDRLDLIGRMYIEGSRKTHCNPQAVLEVLELDNDDYHGEDMRVTSYKALVCAALCMCWLMRAYFQCVPPTPLWAENPELDSKLNSIEDYLAYCISHVAHFHEDHET